ncbi:unnamed protein product (macronuclear) [Paramecium tetraurelia]|uniref:Uncharacterized protein n=1 Tax=Paramecium tetraurelia TaxID=5888 RepID=A0D1Y9_PARTE|nr:uncharacterized protein GSPATT00039190001 [Paramecium tetraurelia]CAK77056.1 unnamed protein product [Paramecium tetraurelia]|eukprot:XP_001444453.1 hypothetical protein (macronuclear) [Paramecium tetraurelia strain d4-2]
MLSSRILKRGNQKVKSRQKGFKKFKRYFCQVKYQCNVLLEYRVTLMGLMATKQSITENCLVFATLEGFRRLILPKLVLTSFKTPMHVDFAKTIGQKPYSGNGKWKSLGIVETQVDLLSQVLITQQNFRMELTIQGLMQRSVKPCCQYGLCDIHPNNLKKDICDLNGYWGESQKTKKGEWAQIMKSMFNQEN